ncbi:MAG TPA: leucine-rich repeat domain-containing protein [Gemmataceae bacterium]|jgi:hypothetical protein|nr:leucine-rich repeat domain-containing protein [Gemmataceae bacterium]
MSESAGFAILVGGVVVIVLGFLWLVRKAFGTSKLWGFGSLLILPVAVVYAIAYRRRALGPVLVMLLGGAVMASSIVINRVYQPPKEAVTEDKGGESRGTLTGASETDVVAYLKAHRNAAVLQMANRADVTDTVLIEHVGGMPNLGELDLNDTPVTDAGLAVLASLPKLEKLRIARTRATADGVANHVLTSPTIVEIDVGGLNVPGKALRDWRNADPMRRKYVN